MTGKQYSLKTNRTRLDNYMKTSTKRRQPILKAIPGRWLPSEQGGVRAGMLRIFVGAVFRERGTTLRILAFYPPRLNPRGGVALESSCLGLRFLPTLSNSAVRWDYTLGITRYVGGSHGYFCSQPLENELAQDSRLRLP
jgi:hypothetical protein